MISIGKRKIMVAGCRRCGQIVQCRLVNAGSPGVELFLYLLFLTLAAVLLLGAYPWLAFLAGAVPFMYSGHRVRNRRVVCKMCGGDDIIPAESVAGQQMPNPNGLPIPSGPGR